MNKIHGRREKRNKHNSKLVKIKTKQNPGTNTFKIRKKPDYNRENPTI